MIKNFVKILELLADRLEVCVSVWTAGVQRNPAYYTACIGQLKSYYCSGKEGVVYLFAWFDVYVPFNSYGHVETASSHNHTFSWASLSIRLTSTSCTYFRL